MKYISKDISPQMQAYIKHNEEIREKYLKRFKERQEEIQEKKMMERAEKELMKKIEATVEDIFTL